MLRSSTLGTSGAALALLLSAGAHGALAQDAHAKRPKQKPFVGNHLWVVSFLDPDGFHIDFESPTEVPEETEYEG